jgi:hypothetical protein
MGAQSPAVDAMFAAGSKDDFVAAVRGLDRALITDRYVIAFWQSTTGRIVHVK